MKTWTKEEISVLLDSYSTVSKTELLCLIPGKSESAIYKKAYRLGLKKGLEAEYQSRSDARKGDKAANWKGGVRHTRRGYRQLLIPGHPRSDAGGYVMEHIVVWEQNTGIRVPDNCVIHHLNGNKADNRMENLCLMERGAHTQLHHRGTKLKAETKKKISDRALARLKKEENK